MTDFFLIIPSNIKEQSKSVNSNVADYKVCEFSKIKRKMHILRIKHYFFLK